MYESLAGALARNRTMEANGELETYTESNPAEALEGPTGMLDPLDDMIESPIGETFDTLGAALA